MKRQAFQVYSMLSMQTRLFGIYCSTFRAVISSWSKYNPNISALLIVIYLSVLFAIAKHDRFLKKPILNTDVDSFGMCNTGLQMSSKYVADLIVKII